MAIPGTSSLGLNRLPQVVMQQRQDRQEKLRGVDNNVSADASKETTNIATDVEGSIITVDTSTAEDMTVFIAQMRSRRDLEKRPVFFADSSLDYILDDEAQEKIESLLNIVKAKNKQAVILQHARFLFPDDSCLIIALRVLLKNLRRRKIFSEEANDVGEVLSEVESKADKKKTNAGINIALKARLFGKKLKMSPATVRTVYRDFIECDEHELTTYEKWLVFYGAERRHILIDFIEKALLTDVEAIDPSCSNVEFGSLLKRISKIKLIRSGDLVFIDGIADNNTTKQYFCAEEKWILFLITTLQRPDSVYENISEVGGMLLKEAPVGAKAEFLQSLLKQCEKIPEGIYSEPLFRVQLLENLQQLIGDAHRIEWESSISDVNQVLFGRISV